MPYKLFKVFITKSEVMFGNKNFLGVENDKIRVDSVIFMEAAVTDHVLFERMKK